MDEGIKLENTEVLAFAEYSEFEAAADKTAIKIKEGFMEMGYILKIARDTDILVGSGYQNHEEFAQRRYGLDKGTVSRYIRIVERFSDGGNSHVLKENYKKMGFAKLSLMLHMPDAIAEELMESLSKNEVLAIKEELDAESTVSDIELAIERAEKEDALPAAAFNDSESSLFIEAVYQFGKENPEMYRKIWKAVKNNDLQTIPDIMAPNGDAVIMVRVPGTGRIMMTIQGETVSAVAVRTQEKERCTIQDLILALVALCPNTETTEEDTFRIVYGMEMEKEPEKAKDSEVAPVQPVKRKASKVTKAKVTKEKRAIEGEKEPLDGADTEQEGSTTGQEKQIPGQDSSILDHPEYMPDGMYGQAAGTDMEDNMAEPAAGVTAEEETVATSQREENSDHANIVMELAEEIRGQMDFVRKMMSEIDLQSWKNARARLRGILDRTDVLIRKLDSEESYEEE